MKAVVLYEQGGVEKLVYTDYPDPEITVSEVSVQVEACALNRLDLKARQDRPEVPGEGVASRCRGTEDQQPAPFSRDED